MLNARALVIVVVILVLLAGTALLLARPSMSGGVGVRRALFAGTVLAALLPFALHAHQVYESLTMLSPTASLHLGPNPALDRFLGIVWLLVIVLSVGGWWLGRRAPAAAAAAPILMCLVYLVALLPHALRSAERGASPTAAPRSWLIGCTVVGVVLLILAARRLRPVPRSSLR
jgi:hypothetical protein